MPHNFKDSAFILDADCCFLLAPYAQKSLSKHATDNPDNIEKYFSLISDPSVVDLRQIFWFLHMHSLIVCTENIADPSKYIRDWAKASEAATNALCWDHMENGNSLKSPWISIAEREISAILNSKYPGSSEISFAPLLESRLTARATKQRRVFVSPLLRPFLRHFNNVILSFAFECIQTAQSDLPAVDLTTMVRDYFPNFARYYLPFMLYGHDYFSTQSLPYITYNSTATYSLASVVTEIQLRFVLLHECGHIVLGHCDVPRHQIEDSSKFEAEADLFALAHLCDEDSFGGKFDVDTIWLAYRLHFFYLVIEAKILGVLNEEMRKSEDEFESRRSIVLKKFLDDYPLKVSNLLEATCSSVLLTYKYGFSRLDKSFLENVLLQIRKPIAKSREPWWNDIKL